MEPIDLEELIEKSKANELDIFKLRQEITRYITVNDDLNVVIDANHLHEARDLQVKINSLINTWKFRRALLAKVREVIDKYNLRGQYFAGDTNILDIDLALARAIEEPERVAKFLDDEILTRKLRHNISQKEIEETIAANAAKVVKIRSDLIPIIENIKKAKKELEEVVQYYN
ncbi:Uncharacterised protein [uncultured archaeon]|nr:Uncharacterised protein [uncultured archaeon]